MDKDTKTETADKINESESVTDLPTNRNIGQPSIHFFEMKSDFGWKYALTKSIVHYFPHYTLKESDYIQIDERPNWLQCVTFGIQHVLAMFSGVIILPLILGYDSNTSLFFSGTCTLIFVIVTGGKIPSFLGCSGSVVSAILSVTGYKFSPGAGLNTQTAAIQGAFLILGLSYIFVSCLVIIFGYSWLEYTMPAIVTGTIVASIGIHLSFISYGQMITSSFDTYIAIITFVSIMLISVYAPFNIMKRTSLMLGTIIGYSFHAICGSQGIGTPIDYSGITESPWIRAPQINYNIEFTGSSIGVTMPLLIVLLAENLGHMKAIESITERPILKSLGRAYLGDAIACVIASLTGTIPFTTYAENIGVLSVTHVFSTLVIVFAAVFAILLGFFAKFSAVVHSIPPGVLGGITLILYSLITITGVRIWVINKTDFNDTRNIYIAGVPVILATVIQTPIKLNNFELDGIGVATFTSIALYQILQGPESLKSNFKKIFLKKQ